MKSRDVEHVHAPRDFFFTEKKMKLKTHFQKNLSFINSSFSNKPFKSILYFFAILFKIEVTLYSQVEMKHQIDVCLFSKFFNSNVFTAYF